jgi:hypothetical protein
MKFSLKILENTNQISKLIMDELKLLLEKAIDKALPIISKQVKDVVGEALRNQPEYSSLMTGTLKAELGISDSSSINSIIEELINTLAVQKNSIAATSKGITGGFTLTMMKSNDMNGVIYSELASVKDIKGYSLPWLEWLLLKGNEILVKNYEVAYNSSPYSRSGMAIMVPSSSSWRVPPQFAGNENDNWTTRAINSVEDSVYKIIQENIEKNL